jgi:hypothetical protein
VRLEQKTAIEMRPFFENRHAGQGRPGKRRASCRQSLPFRRNDSRLRDALVSNCARFDGSPDAAPSAQKIKPSACKINLPSIDKVT